LAKLEDTAMNEFSFGAQPPRYDEEARSPYPAQYQPGAPSTQELAQQILMGMQHDIEAQIDWRLKQRQPRSRGLAPSEIGVILGSIGIGVPLTAIAAASAGLAGLIVICLMLVAVNAAWAVRS
jgi:hypothetical protein